MSSNGKCTSAPLVLMNRFAHRNASAIDEMSPLTVCTTTNWYLDREIKGTTIPR